MKNSVANTIQKRCRVSQLSPWRINRRHFVQHHDAEQRLQQRRRN
jgi:hypothetical protein